MMNRHAARNNIGIVLASLIGVAVIAIMIVNPLRTDHANSNPTKDELDHESVDYISSRSFDDLDELIAASDHVILGTIEAVQDNINQDEYVVIVEKQYKGDTDSKTIYVYENKGTLKKEHQYFLFLNMTLNSYSPHPVYTSSNKDAIVLIDGDEVKHQTSLISKELNVGKLEKRIVTSPGIQVTATEDFTRGHANVEKGPLSLDEVMDRSHLIAHVVPYYFSKGNKYA